MIGAKIYHLFNNGGLPYRLDLSTWLQNRTGVSFAKKIGTNATILPSCGLVDSSNYLIKSTSDFGGGDASGYIEAKVYYNGTSTPIQVFSSRDESSTSRYFVFTIVSGKPRIALRNSLDFTKIMVYNTVLSVGWHTLRWSSDGSTYKFYDNGNEGAVLASTGSNDGKWLDLINNRDNVSIGCSKDSGGVTAGQTAYIAYVDYNNKNKWYLSGVGLYEYDTIGAINMAWTGTAHIYYDINAST
jgi:hypothetical protein